MGEWFQSYAFAVFWGVLALMYLALAAVSLRASSAFDRKLRHATPQWTDKDGNLTFEIPPGPDDAVAIDYWNDLRKYLNSVTRISFVAFVLAAIAACVTGFTAK